MITDLYRLLLRLYPRDYVAQFGAEMTSVFEEASAEQWKRGPLAYVMFVLREIAGLAGGARDARNAAFLVGDLAVDFSIPADLADAQRAVRISREQMKKAMVAQDYKKARFFCLVDDRASVKVQQLRAKYRLPGA
jgi:hypothetical protein